MTRPARFTVQVCKRRCIPTNVPFSIKLLVVGPASTIAQPSNLQGWAQRVQCDEVWSFCYAKEKNVPVEKEGTGAGSVWTWTAIDADSKLILSYLCGGRDSFSGLSVHGGFGIACGHALSDHNRRSPRLCGSCRGCLRMWDYAMLIKLYGAPSDNPETRYSPATCTVFVLAS